MEWAVAHGLLFHFVSYRRSLASSFSQEVSTFLSIRVSCFMCLHIAGDFNVNEAVVCQLYNFGDGACVSAARLLAQSLLCLRIDWVAASSSFPFPVTTFSSFRSWKSIATFRFLVLVHVSSSWRQSFDCLVRLVPNYSLSDLWVSEAEHECLLVLISLVIWIARVLVAGCVELHHSRGGAYVSCFSLVDVSCMTWWCNGM